MERENWMGEGMWRLYLKVLKIRYVEREKTWPDDYENEW